MDSSDALSRSRCRERRLNNSRTAAWRIYYFLSVIVLNWRRRQGDTWARVKSRHGQTLLSLAFNYGILSLKALTIGTEEKEIPVADRPLGCMLQQNESDKIRTVLLLLMRDFKTQEHLTNRSSAPVRFYTQFIIIIIIIITKTMSMSSWQSHCESSPGSFDECRTAPSGRRSKTISGSAGSCC